MTSPDKDSLDSLILTRGARQWVGVKKAVEAVEAS
jgi:hypothetical protein